MAMASTSQDEECGDKLKTTILLLYAFLDTKPGLNAADMGNT